MDPADHQEIKKKTGECEALELKSGVKRKRKTSEAKSVCTASILRYALEVLRLFYVI